MDKEYEALLVQLREMGYVVILEERPETLSEEELLADLKNLVQPYEYVEQAETNPRDDYKAFCVRMARRKK